MGQSQFSHPLKIWTESRCLLVVKTHGWWVREVWINNLTLPLASLFIRQVTPPLGALSHICGSTTPLVGLV